MAVLLPGGGSIREQKSKKLPPHVSVPRTTTANSGGRPVNALFGGMSATSNPHHTETILMAKITSDPFPTIANLRGKYIETPRDSILQQHLDRLLQRDANGQLLPKPVIYASRGRFGRCIENIIAALEVAALRGESQLTMQHFAESWAMQEGVVPGKNVFLSPRWASIDLAKLHEAA